MTRNLLDLLKMRISINKLAVAALLTSSVFLGWRASPRILLLVIGVVGGAAGLSVLWRWPSLGVIGLVVAALCVPFTIGTGTQTSINIAVMGVAGLTGLWLVRMLLKRDVTFVSVPTNKPLLVFLVVATLSLIAGNISWNYFAGRASLASQVGGWTVFAFSVLAYWLAANEVKDRRWLKGLVFIFIFLGSVYLTGRWILFLGSYTNRVFQPGSVGSQFWIWLAVLPAGQAIFNTKLALRYRAALLTITFMSLLLGWRNRDWASGWLPAAVGLLVLVWLLSWKLGLLATIIGLAGIGLWKPEIFTELTQADQYSIFTRGVAAQIILGQVLKANPILGLGPSNYYFHTQLYPILGYYVKFNSHSQYVDIIAQLGIIGMMSFIWVMMAIGKLGFKIRGSLKHGFELGYVNSCLAGLAGMLVAGFLGDWLLPFVYNIGLSGFRASVLGWIFLGGMVVLINPNELE